MFLVLRGLGSPLYSSFFSLFLFFCLVLRGSFYFFEFFTWAFFLNCEGFFFFLALLFCDSQFLFFFLVVLLFFIVLLSCVLLSYNIGREREKGKKNEKCGSLLTFPLN
jgi:hypothetical protein